MEEYVTALLESLGGQVPDTIVLGCTHYPLIAPLFEQFLPPGVKVLSQPDVVAASLSEYLQRHPEFRRIKSRIGKEHRYRFLTTGDPVRVSATASRFLGQEIIFAAA